MTRRRWVALIGSILLTGIVLGAAGTIALKRYADWGAAVTGASTALAALFAPVAGIAAFLAARASATAAASSAQVAREARQALALHHEPNVAFIGRDETYDNLWTDRIDAANPDGWPAVGLVVSNVGGLTDVVASWVLVGGQPRHVALRAGEGVLVLEGIQKVTPGLVTFTVECRDLATHSLWRYSGDLHPLLNWGSARLSLMTDADQP